MAGAHCAITTFLAPPAITTTTTTTTTRTAVAKKLLVVSSSIPAPFPTKLTKRRNHLRPKILKTLTKPFPNTTTTTTPTPTPILLDEPSTIPIIPIESDVALPSEEYSGESRPESDGEVEKGIEVSETSVGSVAVAGVSDGVVGKFSTRSVMKLGMYLVGIFVFQTIVSVWFLGSADSDKKDENSERENKIRVLESSKNGNGVGNLFHGKSGFKPGGFGYVDELELEDKIVEIRALAREARRIEKRERNKNGLVSDFDDDDDDDDEDGDDVNVNGNGNASVKVRSGIEKEVDARLVELKNRLSSAKGKSQGSPVGNLSKTKKVEDRISKESLGGKQLNGGLLFEKKHRFRSQSTEPRNDPRPKGFQGANDRNASNKKKTSSDAIDAMAGSGSIGSNGSELFVQGNLLDLPDKDFQGDAGETLKEGAGVVQDTTHGKLMGRANKSRESSELETRNSFSFGKENQAVSASSNKRTVPSRNGSSKSREVGSKPMGNNARDKQSEAKNDLWWLKLPYVLAILLRRSSDPEGPGGLYTLKITSPDQNDSPYTVAFEDRGDANNFCYLLESFFEDLGDFSADIVPLSTKELQEGVQSRTMKLIVVKKGQLQLYAGQPLADVEMDLRSLAE